MLSVVIATDHSERALVSSLAALIPGATAGLIAEVIVADAGSRDRTADVADFAGCRMMVSSAPLGERLTQAAATARAPWLLFLPVGAAPQGAWIEEITRFIEEAERHGRSDTVVAAFRLLPPASAARSPLREAAGLIGEAVGLPRIRRQGLLIAKQHYRRIGGHGGAATRPDSDILRRLASRHVVTLRCGATT